MVEVRVSGGADFLQLSPASAPTRGLTSWLADAIRAAIIDGRLRVGATLPATRVLADDLGVSRGVIVEAYQRLMQEGLVGGRPGAGTRVLRTSGPGDIREPGASMRTGGMPGPGELPQRWRSQAELDLSPGVPDLSGFPRAAWLRAERLVLERASAADLGYGDPRGSEAARTARAGWVGGAPAGEDGARLGGESRLRQLAGWLPLTRGLRADPGDIIVVTGVAQALALL